MSVIESKMGGDRFSVTHRTGNFGDQDILEGDSAAAAAQKAVHNMLENRWNTFKGSDLRKLVDRVKSNPATLNDIANALQNAVNAGTIDDQTATRLMGRVVGETQYLTEGDIRDQVAGLDHFSDLNVDRWETWSSRRRGAQAISRSVLDGAKDGELSEAELDSIWEAAKEQGEVSLWDLSAAFRRLQVMADRGQLSAEQMDRLSEQLATKLLQSAEVDSELVQSAAEEFLNSFASGLASGVTLAVSTPEAATQSITGLLEDGKLGYGELVGLWRSIHQDDRDLTSREVENLGRALWTAMDSGELSPASYDRAVRFFNNRIRRVTQGNQAQLAPFDVMTIDRNGNAWGLSPDVARILERARNDEKLDVSELDRALSVAARDRLISDVELENILAVAEQLPETDLEAIANVLVGYARESRLQRLSSDGTTAASNPFYENGVSFALSAEARSLLARAFDAAILVLEGGSGRPSEVAATGGLASRPMAAPSAESSSVITDTPVFGSRQRAP